MPKTAANVNDPIRTVLPTDYQQLHQTHHCHVPLRHRRRHRYRFDMALSKIHTSTAKGEQDTFDHQEREHVPDDVIVLTLRYVPPTVSAMVQVQGMTGIRPTELCTMRVGDVYQSGDVWKYRPKNHKTEAYIVKKAIDLGKPEQDLIVPYLIGKEAGSEGDRIRAESG
jgi:hypothetical protein